MLTCLSSVHTNYFNILSDQLCLHVREEEEEEELWRMEMDRNRREVRSPYFVPILRLKPCWQAWTRNLNEIVLSHARQAAVAQQHTAELSGVLKTQDRMESSIHGSAGGSPNPDLWTSSPEVTSFPDVAPSAACCPLSNPITVSIRSIADYTRCSLEQTILPHLRVEPPLTMRQVSDYKKSPSRLQILGRPWKSTWSNFDGNHVGGN